MYTMYNPNYIMDLIIKGLNKCEGTDLMTPVHDWREGDSRPPG